MSTQTLPQGSLRPVIALPHPGLQVHSIAAPKADKRLSFLMSAAIYCVIAGGGVLLAREAPALIAIIKTEPLIAIVDLVEKPLEARITPAPPTPRGSREEASRPDNLVPLVLPPMEMAPEFTPTALPTTDLSNQIAADPSLPISKNPRIGTRTDGHPDGNGDGVVHEAPVEVSFAAVQVLKQIQPVYPNLARLSHKEGDVILMMTINEQGVPTDVRMDRGDTIFLNDAVRAAQQWRFTPAQVDGRPHAARFKLILQFKLRV